MSNSIQNYIIWVSIYDLKTRDGFTFKNVFELLLVFRIDVCLIKSYISLCNCSVFTVL